jgi:hypothetical protein
MNDQVSSAMLQGQFHRVSEAAAETSSLSVPLCPLCPFCPLFLLPHDESVDDDFDGMAAAAVEAADG